MEHETDVKTVTVGATKGWVKALLVGSLALNLAVVGLGAGLWLGWDKGPAQMRRDFGLGPLAAALHGGDWKAMRPIFMAKNPDLKSGLAQLRAEYQPLIAALRAEPFEPARFDAALVAISRANHARIDTTTEVLGGYIVALPTQARADYADRLQETLDRLGQKAPPPPAAAQTQAREPADEAGGGN